MKQQRSQDADYVNNIVARYSANARNTGKIIAVLVIILSLFIPNHCKASFVLGMVYLALEYFYCISITIMNKYVLRKYFVPVEDGYVLKENANPSPVSRKIATYGSIQMIINALIIVAAIVCAL